MKISIGTRGIESSLSYKTCVQPDGGHGSPYFPFPHPFFFQFRSSAIFVIGTLATGQETLLDFDEFFPSYLTALLAHFFVSILLFVWFQLTARLMSPTRERALLTGIHVIYICGSVLAHYWLHVQYLILFEASELKTFGKFMHFPLGVFFSPFFRAAI
jgi:hypothetical protein